MTTNTIKKECPNCKNGQADILGAKIRARIKDEKTIRESFNRYKCLKCSFPFEVKRDNDEQELVERYIKASSIKLD